LRPQGKGPRRGGAFAGPGKGGPPRPRGPRVDFDENQPHSNANASPFGHSTLTVPGGAPRGNGEGGFASRGNRSGPRGRPGSGGGAGGGKGGGQFRGKGGQGGPNPHRPAQPRPRGGEADGNVAPRGAEGHAAPAEADGNRARAVDVQRTQTEVDGNRMSRAAEVNRAPREVDGNRSMRESGAQRPPREVDGNRTRDSEGKRAPVEADGNVAASKPSMPRTDDD